MTVRPGVNAVRLAAALFVLALLTFLTAQAVWLLVAGVAVGLVLAVRDYLALQQRFSQVTILRNLPAVIGRGDPFEVEWTVSAADEFLRDAELRDEIPDIAEPRMLLKSLESVAQQTLTQDFMIPHRGRYTFGPLWLRLSGPTRFLDAQESINDRASIRVLPETYASPDRFLKEIGAEIRLLDKPVFARQHGDGTEFESLKEYRPGDDPRRIDWRATARMQRPIVRRFQIERHRDVIIVIDCGRLMGGRTPRGSKLDCAVDSALLLAKVALQGGDRCGFALFDHSVRGYLAPVTGLPSMPALVDSVYDAAVDWGESDFAPLFATLQRRQAKRSLLVVLSDVLDAATSEQFRGSLRRLSQRHVVLFAALRTPLLNEVLARPIEDFVDASRQAVTFRLLHDREQALQTLRHAGVHVLDVEPQQLTAPLINEFIAIRRRNLL